MHRLIMVIVSALAISSWSAGCSSDEGGETGQGGAATTTQAGTGGLGGQGGLGGGGEAAQGGEGAGGSQVCVDTGEGEPNDDPADAVNLLVVTDDDPEFWPFFAGVIAGNSDVDWYTFLGTDEPVAYVDPELTFDPEDTELTLCAYFWCTDAGAWGPPEIGSGGSGGGPAHVCPPGTTEATLDLSSIEFGGVNMGVAPGCCTDEGEGAFHLGEDLFNTFWTPFTCEGLTDDMKVFISVTAPHGSPEDTCEPYIVRYHY